MGRNDQNTLHCPEALSRERIRSLRGLHETAADDLSAALSSLLRCPVEMSLVEAVQMPYGDFLGRLGNTTHINLLRASPSGDAVLLEIELPVLYPMIDRLLGGCREDEPPPRRPLSDIEQPLAARLVRAMIQHLSLALHDTAEIKLELERTESNPRLMRALPTDEMTVAIEFQATVGVRRGKMRLCIPCRTVQRLDLGRAADPDTDRAVVYHSKKETNAEPTTSVEVSVTLASTPITAAELMSLQVGDIVATETTAGEPAVVSLCGEPKFLATPGSCRGRKAIRITSPIRDETR